MYKEREGLIQPGESMQELKGKSVFGGIAIGRISVYNKDESTVKRVKIEDTAAEVKRFEEAKETAKEQLQALRESTGGSRRSQCNDIRRTSDDVG